MNSWVKVLCCSHFTQCIDKLIIDLHTSSMLEDVWGDISSQGRCALIVLKKKHRTFWLQKFAVQRNPLCIYNTNTKHCKHVYTVQCNFTFISSTNAHTHTPCTYPFAYVCLYIPLYTRHVQYYLLCTWHSHTHTHIHSAHFSHTKYISFIHPTNMSLTLIKYLRKFHVCFMFSCMWIYIYIYTYLDSPAPHNFRSLWIFGCGPNNHFWAKSDGFNDTVLVSKSRSFASFLRHLRYICGSSKCDWQRAKSAIVRFLVAHYFSVQTKKNAAFGCPGIYIYIHI